MLVCYRWRGAGSMVSLAFGEKLQRKRPLRNPTLSPEQRKFDGEFVLFVKDSAWRVLSENNKVICTSDDNNESGGPMLSGLNQLIGSYVFSINVANDNGGLDLFLVTDYVSNWKVLTALIRWIVIHCSIWGAPLQTWVVRYSRLVPHPRREAVKCCPKIAAACRADPGWCLDQIDAGVLP